MSLEWYVDKFQNLNTNSQNGRKSPHKVCMLLAVMDLIQAGRIHQNKILFDSTLKERFSHFFGQMSLGNDRNTPENPFYHLKSEGFWHLVYHDGVDPDTVKRYSAKNVSHAFLDDELFDYINSSITVNVLKEALTNNLSDLASLFQQWLLDIGKSEKTAKNYLQAIRGSISNWMYENQLVDQPLVEVKSFSQFHRLVEKIKQVDEFKIRDSRGKGMYSAALNAYQRFLADLSQIDLRADVQQILQDTQLNETEKSILVSTRMGQGTFRKQLVDMWRGCAITGYKNTQLLVASHIKPWRDADNHERLDKFNGLLLLANLDKAFDLGFISFNDAGKVMISGQLEAPEVLGLQEEMAFHVRQEHKKYLAHHRAELFKGF
ncbi:putative type II restriction endonuclease [Photobacterium marinum]|uniref:Putative type II restriction endonuclease n=1 Tax=Photobacterium marinum TaxID=1056511 RepID=L8J8D1_9GAMM|nr:HNH endonuclease [Photobacterium marinum]ELR63789.1 putative type II restriction endonuclease [Photobacterium marinum]